MNLGTLTPSPAIRNMGGLKGQTITGKIFTDLTEKEAVYLYDAASVDIDGCLFLRCKTSMRAVMSANVRMLRSAAIDLMPTPGERTNFVQFDKGDGGQVGECVVTNGPKSAPEDIISTYRSSDILINANQIRGGGPSVSGTGLLLGDGDTDRNNQPTHGCVAEDNVLVNTGQVGAGIAGGTNHTLRRNLIFGDQRPNANVGMYIANQTQGSSNTGHTGVDNRVNWKRADGQRNDWWFYENERVTQSGNVHADTLTAAIFTETINYTLAGRDGGQVELAGIQHVKAQGSTFVSLAAQVAPNVVGTQRTSLARLIAIANGLSVSTSFKPGRVFHYDPIWLTQ